MRAGGGWQVGANYSWILYHDWKVCGEWLRERREAMLKATDGGAVGGGEK